MKNVKRIILVSISILSLFVLSSCGESDEAKLKRLQDDATQKRKEAQEAQDNYNMLKNFVDKYGNN